MLKFGNISDVNEAKGLARVNFKEDEMVSGWLPMAVPKSKGDKYSIPFEIDEHVACLMDDHCENGVILCAIYDTNNTPDGGAKNKTAVKFAANLRVEYDRETSTLSISGDGNLKIDTTGNVNIKCQKAVIESLTDAEIKAVTQVKITAPDTEISGAVTVAGALTAASISTSGGGNVEAEGDITTSGTIQGGTVKQGTVELGTHVHSGVQTGGGSSGPPV